MSLEDLLETHWAVAYLLCVPCSGIFQPGFVMFPFYVLLDERGNRGGMSSESGAAFLCFTCCVLCGWLVVYSIAMANFRSNDEGRLPAPETEPDDALPPLPMPVDVAFNCNWACKVLPWLPSVELMLGLVSLAGAGVGWVIRMLRDGFEDDSLIECAAFCLMSAMGCVFFLWPVSVTEEEIVANHWTVAYMFAPFCTLIGGPGWMLGNMACCSQWLLQDCDSCGDGVPMAAGCLAVGLTIPYVIFTVLTRRDNSEWQPAQSMVELSDCNSQCQVLYAPLAMLIVGWGCAIGSWILKCTGRREDEFEWEEMFAALVVCIPALWPTVFLTFFQESLITMNPWLAGLTLPVYVGCFGLTWMVAWMGVFLEHARDTSLENIVHPETLIKGFGVASLALTASLSGSVYTLRSKAHAEGPTHGEMVTAEFSCTWPCLVLRGVIACAFGVGVFSLVFVVRSMLAGPGDDRECCTRHQQDPGFACLNFVHLFIGAAIIAGSVFEAAKGSPIEMPVEGLVTGPAFWLYLLIPLMTTAGFVLGWKALTWASTPRIRMLSRLYRAQQWVAVLAFVGSSWLLYVLRHSVDVEPEPFSRRTKNILWQAVGIPYVGVSLLLWCWGFKRAEAEARRQALRIVLKVLFLYLPAGSWTLIAVMVTDDHSVLDHQPDWLVSSGIAFALVGFLYELVNFIAPDWTDAWLPGRCCRVFGVCVSLALCWSLVFYVNCAILLSF